VALARLCAKVPGDTRLRAARDSAAILARAARVFFGRICKLQFNVQAACKDIKWFILPS
jgi:hypothetical protein